MPPKKKHPKDMTTDEAIQHLFGAKGARHLKRAAGHLEPKPQVKSIKKKSK